MKAKGLTLRGYARHRARLGLPGATLNAVQTALEHGRITRGADGKIDPVAADRSWLETTDPSKRPPPPEREAELAGELLLRPPVDALYRLRELLVEMSDGLFQMTGPRCAVEGVVTRWAKLPEVLNELEDGMRDAGVPLLQKDMPTHTDPATHPTRTRPMTASGGRPI